jgi:preprotein translocase subunit YajC
MDPFLIIVVVALGLFVFMQFRTAKKRRNEAAELQEKMLPGTEIMTNYGLYGTIVSIDDENNVALIETTPGTVLRIHRQTILKTVDDVVADDVDGAVDDDAVIEASATDAAEPQFGERLDDDGAKKDRE